MLSIYNLPGRIVANLWYLWPKKGQVWASARRKDNPFVHFVYSTVVYLLLLYILLAPRAQPSSAVLATPRQADPASQGAVAATPVTEQESQEPSDSAPSPPVAAPAAARTVQPALPPPCSATVHDRCVNPSESSSAPPQTSEVPRPAPDAQ